MPKCEECGFYSNTGKVGKIVMAEIAPHPSNSDPSVTCPGGTVRNGESDPATGTVKKWFDKPIWTPRPEK